MSSSDDLKRTKALIGKFYEEMKSNSIVDFLVWLDCKLAYDEQLKKEQEEMLKRSR